MAPSSAVVSIFDPSGLNPALQIPAGCLRVTVVWPACIGRMTASPTLSPMTSREAIRADGQGASTRLVFVSAYNFTVRLPGPNCNCAILGSGSKVGLIGTKGYCTDCLRAALHVVVPATEYLFSALVAAPRNASYITAAPRLCAGVEVTFACSPYSLTPMKSPTVGNADETRPLDRESAAWIQIPAWWNTFVFAGLVR